MRIKLLLLCTVLMQYYLLADGKTKLYNSQEYKTALDFFENKNYSEALKRFDTLVYQYPNDEKINFYYGRSAFELQNYEFAFAAFDRVLIQNSKNHRARLEYARTLYMLEAYDEAKKEFEKVLLSPIPAHIRKNITTFLKNIKTSKRNYILNSLAIFGLGWDDNLNNNTYENTTVVASLPLENDTNTLKDYNYRLLLHNNLILPFQQNTNLAWESSATTYMQEQKKYHQKDLLFLSLASGFSSIKPNHKNLFSFTYDHIWIGGDQKIYIYGVANNTKYNLSKQHLFDFDLKLKNKKMIQDIDKDKNSSIKELGLNYNYLFSNQLDRIALSLYKIMERKKDGNRTDISSDTNRYKIVYGKRFPLDFTLDLSYLYEQKDFKIKFSGLPLREDRKESYSMKLTKQIDKEKAIFGEFVKSDNRSNINSYKYKKNSFTLNYLITF
jgi:hypothetical protein